MDGGEAEEPDSAVAGPQQAEQQADEGRLAGAVRPEQADDLAASDREVCSGYGGERAEGLCCLAGLGEDVHRLPSRFALASAATTTASSRPGRTGCTPVRQAARRGPYPPAGAAPPGQGGRALGPRPAVPTAPGMSRRMSSGVPLASTARRKQDDGGGPGRLVHVGRGDHGRCLLPRPGDEPPQVSAADRVDPGGRLVEDRRLGGVQQGQPHGQLALHPAG